MVKYFQHTRCTGRRNRASHVMVGVLLCLSSYNSAWANDSLGRLFTNPPQRADFEHKREIGYIPPNAEANNNESNSNTDTQHTEQNSEQSPPPPNTLRINGLVTRNNNPRLLWLNDQLIQTPFSHSQAKIGKINDSGAVLLKAPGKRPVAVKTGQQLVLDQGKVIEAYETPEQPSQYQIIRHPQ